MYDLSYDKRPGQNKDFQNKLFFFILITIFSFFILIVMIGNISIIKNLSYSIKSTKNREKAIRIPPIRGNIYSSDGQLLAHNINSFNVYITPYELDKDSNIRQKEILCLSEVLKYDYSDIEKLLKDQKKYKEDILIAENISFDKFIKIKENMHNMPGISIKEALYREYPNKSILSHVLGHTGPISQSELAIKQKEGYYYSDRIGKNGIEKYYENILRGKSGKKVFLIDARMIIQEEIKEKEIKPIPGKELILTIDLEFQKNVEDILADRIGTILAIKPSTGEILAMASYPDFDPNIYVLQTKENSKKKRQISLDTRGTPLINRNIQSLYPPASVFKLVTVSAILNENIIPVNDKFYCNGIFRLNNET
ncbi:MAG: hypothetical protein KAT05_01155, partial [Spirochaetes bacterium]|nr:hypothetical protein [Spirochaetota bacterium]